MNTSCVLLDTNIVSYLYRRDPSAASVPARIAGRTSAICSQTLAELHYGALKRNWGQRRYNGLLAAIKNYLVIDTDAETAESWAKLSLAAEVAGKPMSAEDLWVLATAVRWELPLLTSDKAFAWYDKLVELIEI